MKVQDIQATIEFMKRVELRGEEVPAFNRVMNALADDLKAMAAELRDQTPPPLADPPAEPPH